MKLQFTKMHGAGNDFVVIDATRAPFRPAPGMLQKLADRRYGVGCDQVLVIEPPSTPDVDFDYRIFNPDGSEVGQCGNGSRALARYVHEHRLSDKAQIRVRTATAVLELRRAEAGLYQVDMSVPEFDPLRIPLRMPARAERYELTLDDGRRIEFGAVSVGNPHAVILVEDVDHAPVGELGPRVQAHPAFPDGVNVGFLQVLSPANARLRVYERGAGETLACGSGACAAAVVGQLWQLLGPVVEMQLRGGTLRIEWRGEGEPVRMTGPAETVFTGEIEWPS